MGRRRCLMLTVVGALLLFILAQLVMIAVLVAGEASRADTVARVLAALTAPPAAR